MSVGIAYSYLSLFSKGMLDQQTTEAIDGVLSNKESDWSALWKKVHIKIKEENEVPYSIFLITSSGFGRLMKTFLEGIFPNRNVILVGDTNAFTRELIKKSPDMARDEKILIMASFSNFLN